MNPAFNSFNRYFLHIKSDSKKNFQTAIFPLLISDWRKNSIKLIETIQQFSYTLDEDIYVECIAAIKNYINSRNFAAEGRYETTSYLFGAVQYISESAELQLLNHQLDQLIENIPPKETAWAESFKNLYLKTAFALMQACNCVKNNPASTMIALLYGQAMLTASFSGKFQKQGLTNVDLSITGSSPIGRKLMSTSELPILVNNTLMIEVGQTVVLTNENLAAIGSNGNDENLKFHAVDIQHGYFDFVVNPGVNITNFYQQNITNLQIRFVHDDSTIAPAYQISVSDDDANTDLQPATITFKGHYEKFGGEFNVGNIHMPLAQDHEYIGIAGLQNETFVVTWDTIDFGLSVFSQLLDLNGDKIGSVIRVDPDTSVTQGWSSVARLKNENFITIWCVEGSNNVIYGQIFNPFGERVGSKFPVSTYEPYCKDDIDYKNQRTSVASLDNGNFVAVWIKNDRNNIKGQIFNLNGEKLGTEFTANTYITHSLEVPAVANLADDRFVVIWVDRYENNYSYGQTFNSVGEKIGLEFAISTSGVHYGYIPPSIKSSNSGNFLVVFEEQANEPYIRGQLFNSTVNKLGSQFAVSTYNIAYWPSVTSLSNGNFVVVWASNKGDASDIGIYGQLLDPMGEKVGVRFRISSVDGRPKYPSVASLTSNKFVVCWEKDPNVLAQIYYSNTAPVLENNLLTVNKGESVVLNITDISATDFDNDNLTYDVSNIKHGNFTLLSDPNTVITKFAQSQIEQGQVQFTHDNMSITPSFDISVSDGKLSTSPVSANIIFDQMPFLDNNFLVINEGGAVILNSTMLSASDVDTNNATLIFTINGLQHGQFDLFLNPMILNVNQFNQSLVTQNKVQFTHDGSEFPPYYEVAVGDGVTITESAPADITFIHVNDLPVLLNNALNVTEGQSVILSNMNLNATDADDNDASLIFVISNLQHGQFNLLFDPIISNVLQFNQSLITQGKVQFTHNGGELAPIYAVSINDGGAQTTPDFAVISFENNVNDMPVLGNNALTIEEGASIILDPTKLSATDSDNNPATLLFNITDIQHVWFDLLHNSGVEISLFNQSLVIQGKVRVTHDGGEIGPSYMVSVCDGQLCTEPVLPQISFGNGENDAPYLWNNTLTISENQNKTLSSFELSATDSDNNDRLLTFIISDIENGRFELSTQPDIPITQFNQSHIMDGQVIFKHDGSEIKPKYKVTVTDGQLSTSPALADVKFTNINDAPIVQYHLGDLMAQIDKQFIFDIPEDTFFDVDGDELTLTIRQQNNQPRPNWLFFFPELNRLFGMPSENDIGNVYLKVTADDGHGEQATDYFKIAVRDPSGEENDPTYTEEVLDKLKVALPVTTLTTTLGLGIWFWKRKKNQATSREKDCFANYLRAALKLDGIADFDSTAGQRYLRILNGTISADRKSVIKGGLVQKLAQEGYEIALMDDGQLKQFAEDVAEAIRRHTTREIGCCGCGYSKITLDAIELKLDVIAKEVPHIAKFNYTSYTANDDSTDVPVKSDDVELTEVVVPKITDGESETKEKQDNTYENVKTDGQVKGLSDDTPLIARTTSSPS